MILFNIFLKVKECETDCEWPIFTDKIIDILN